MMIIQITLITKVMIKAKIIMEMINIVMRLVFIFALLQAKMNINIYSEPKKYIKITSINKIYNKKKQSIQKY
jgi:hypothetical protein